MTSKSCLLFRACALNLLFLFVHEAGKTSSDKGFGFPSPVRSAACPRCTNENTQPKLPPVRTKHWFADPPGLLQESFWPFGSKCPRSVPRGCLRECLTGPSGPKLGSVRGHFRGTFWTLPRGREPKGRRGTLPRTPPFSGTPLGTLLGTLLGTTFRTLWALFGPERLL